MEARDMKRTALWDFDEEGFDDEDEEEELLGIVFL